MINLHNQIPSKIRDFISYTFMNFFDVKFFTLRKTVFQSLIIGVKSKRVVCSIDIQRAEDITIIEDHLLEEILAHPIIKCRRFSRNLFMINCELQGFEHFVSKLVIRNIICRQFNLKRQSCFGKLQKALSIFLKDKFQRVFKGLKL